MSENSGPFQQSQFLTFHIGSDEYAVDILQVREVLGYTQVTRMPNAPPCIRGVMNLRGQVVPVIDLPAKFGMPSAIPTRRTCIVIVEIGGRSELTTMGIVVDSVDQAVDLSPADISPPPDFGTPIDVSYLHGIGKAPHGFVLVLDVERVLSTSELSIAASLGKQDVIDQQASKTTLAENPAPVP
jgi:purine-binding chemotaxis protein CheW